MAGIVDRYTPDAPYPRLLVAFALSSVPLTLFCFGTVVLLNTYRPTDTIEGIPGLVLLALFGTLLVGTHAAHALVRDVAERASDPETDLFPRLAGATAAATAGVPAFVYGLFALTWPIQLWLYVGRVGSVAVLLAGVLALVTAHSQARSASERVTDEESTAGTADGGTGDETALESLKRRYANGELSEAEFERKLERLVELDESLGTADGTRTVSPGELAEEHLLERE
jgi:uncharacterized membrane protein